MKDHSISVYQARYATYIVAKYLDTSTVKTSTKCYKTTFPSEMICTKDDAFKNDEQVENLIREFNIYYRACIGSLIYLLYKIVNLSFSAYKLANFSPNLDKVHFEGLLHKLGYIWDNKIIGLNYDADMKYVYLSELLRKDNTNS